LQRTPPEHQSGLMTIEEYKNLYNTELYLYSYYIPPSFSEHLAQPASASAMTRIELLKMNLELQLFVQRRSIDEILDREK
jgi:hypothetical protein